MGSSELIGKASVGSGDQLCDEVGRAIIGDVEQECDLLLAGETSEREYMPS